MESDLRVALEKGQLRVVFQPSVDASSEAVTGFEALIRWDHPEHGPVSPALFIPLAEEIGLINEIGEWVLRTACAEAVKWPQHSVGRGQPVPDPVQGARTSVHRQGRAERRRARRQTAGAGDHRRRAAQQRRACSRHDRQSEKDRRETRARRLRNGLFKPQLFAAGPVRQDQDRPVFRARRIRSGKPQRRPDPRHGRPGVGSPDADDGRRRRNAGGAPAGPEPRLLSRPGIYLRQADAGRRGAGACREGRAR